MIDCEKIIKRKGKKNKNTIRNCKLGIISAIYILKLFFFNFLVFFFIIIQRSQQYHQSLTIVVRRRLSCKFQALVGCVSYKKKFFFSYKNGKTSPHGLKLFRELLNLFRKTCYLLISIMQLSIRLFPWGQKKYYSLFELFCYFYTGKGGVIVWDSRDKNTE